MPASSEPAPTVRSLSARLAWLGPLGTVIVAGLSLLDYLAGKLSAVTDQVPMAVSTAICFLLLALATLLLLYPKLRPAGWVCRGGEMAGGLTALYGGLVLLAGLTGWPVNPDAGWVSIRGVTAAGYPVGFMSLVAGMLFLLAGLALAIGARCQYPKPQTRNWLAVSRLLGGAVAGFGLLFIMAYALSAPLLYGGLIIPFALPTAIGFTLLGLSLVMQAKLRGAGAETGIEISLTRILEQGPRLGLGLLLLLFLLFGILAWKQATLQSEQTNTLYEQPWQVRLIMGQLRSALLNLEEDAWFIYDSAASPEAQAALEREQAHLAEVREGFLRLREIYAGPLTDIEAARTAFEDWLLVRAEDLPHGAPADASGRSHYPEQKRRIVYLRRRLSTIEESVTRQAGMLYLQAQLLRDRQNRQFFLVMFFGIAFLVWIARGIDLGFGARQRSECALRAANAYLDNLFEHSAAVILVWDSRGVVTQCNAAMARMTGYGAEELIGRPLARLFPFQANMADLSRLSALAAAGAGTAVEITVHTATVRPGPCFSMPHCCGMRMTAKGQSPRWRRGWTAPGASRLRVNCAAPRTASRPYWRHCLICCLSLTGRA